MSLSHAVKDAGWASEPAADISIAKRLELSQIKDAAEPGCRIGVDIGGTKIHMVRWDLDGVAESYIRTDPRGSDHVLVDVEQEINTLIGEKTLESVVVGVPGTIDRASGKLGIAPNLPGWDTFDVPKEISDRLGVPVRVENELDLAAYGEYAWTVSSNLSFIALGTGIGFGAVIDGEIVHGTSGQAGEVFDIPVVRETGEIIGLEQIVCGPGLEARYRELSGSDATSHEILATLRSDQRAAEAFNDLIDPLALFIATVHSVLEPEAIVLGGGLGSTNEVLEATISKLHTFRRRHTPVIRSSLGWRAGAVGALALASSLV